jgi:thiosulfate/3-mercaptopyruvate sulfurtransferase
MKIIRNGCKAKIGGVCAACLKTLAAVIFLAAGQAWAAGGTGPTGETGAVFLSPAQLKALIGKPGFKVIDARSAADYSKGHIAGAISIPWNRIQVPERNGLRNKWADDSVLEQVFAQAGLSYDDKIVMYDAGTIGAGPVFAIFTYAGFADLRVLDGGFDEWDGAADKTPAKPAPSSFTLSRKNGSFVVEKDYVAGKIGDPQARIVEGRTKPAYDDGHIPTARHLDPATHVKDGEFLKPRKELLADLEKKGITPDKQIVLYCGSGGAASRNFMVLRELGFKDLKVYLNAWDDWSIDTSKGQELGVPNFSFAGSILQPGNSLGPRFFSQSELLTALQQKSVLVLDVRSAADYNIGRIAGSVNVYWNDTLDANRNPKSRDSLTALFAAKGVSPDKHIVIFTRGGTQLAYTYTLLKLLGYPNVSAYTGRWDGWEMPSWKAVAGG